MCLKQISALFHNATLKLSEKNNTVFATKKIQPLLFVLRVMEKPNKALTFS